VEHAVEGALVRHSAAVVLLHVAAGFGHVAAEVTGRQEGGGDHLRGRELALGRSLFACYLQVIVNKTVNCNREVIPGKAWGKDCQLYALTNRNDFIVYKSQLELICQSAMVI
jgi:hypothetical protein